jgi:Bacterial extracellular solute-binding protein
MNSSVLNKIVAFFTVVLFLMVAPTHAVAASPNLLKAKQEAESRGYIFVSSREEIINRAKKEGQLRVFNSLREAIKPITNAFNKKYPFIEAHVQEFMGTDDAQRILLQLKAGTFGGLDVTRTPSDFYSEYLQFVSKFDILGMAQSGVLNIPITMIDSINRNVVAVVNRIQVVAYNKNLISENSVPDKWEDFLKPEFKGRKFVADVRGRDMASLVSAWGLEKTVEFARKLAAQKPVWVRGGDRTLVSVDAGEYSLFMGPNLDSVKPLQAKSPNGVLGYKIVEPVPTRYGEETAVLKTAEHPYGALLWLEFLASPEAQKIMDKYKPGGTSLSVQGSILQAETKGKEMSLVQWGDHTKMEAWGAKIVEAYGFPKAETK